MSDNSGSHNAGSPGFGPNNLGPDSGSADQPVGSGPLGPEYLDAAAGAPLDEIDSPTSSGKRRGLVVAGSLVAAGVVGAGAWATTAFLSAGAQPAEALPASTLAYVSVDMTPSGQQVIEAYRFAKKFPAVSEEFDLDENGDPRQQLFEWLQDQGTCEDLDYASDVEPWLGTSAAIAAIDLGEPTVAPVAVLAVEDEKLAETGLKKLAACDDSDGDGGGWSIAGDWAVLAEDDETAAEVLSATERSPLSASSEHAKWLDEVGDQGVMTMYVSPDALTKAMDYAQEANDDPALTDLFDQYRGIYDDFGGMAATVRFRDEGLELVAASDATLNGVEISGTGAGRSVASLPEDTVAAAGISVGDDYAKTLLDQLTVFAEAGGADDVNQVIADLEEQSGLDLPDDLQTLLGESLVISISDTVDLDQVVNSSDGSDVPVGFKITGDADAIEEVLGKLRSTFGPDAEVLLGSDSANDVVVVGPSEEYRAELLDAGALGESETFADVVGEVSSSSGVLFVDFDGADNWLEQVAKDSGDDDLAKNLEPLRGMGMNARLDGDVATVTVRVVAE
ncbi:MAG: hypothetical protein ACRCYU_22475 [Nocardioides sp.]